MKQEQLDAAWLFFPNPQEEALQLILSGKQNLSGYVTFRIQMKSFSHIDVFASEKFSEAPIFQIIAPTAKTASPLKRNLPSLSQILLKNSNPHSV